MKKALLKNSDETKKFNIYSSTVNHISEIVIQNHSPKTNRNYQSVNLLEMIHQIKCCTFVVQ